MHTVPDGVAFLLFSSLLVFSSNVFSITPAQYHWEAFMAQLCTITIIFFFLMYTIADTLNRLCYSRFTLESRPPRG